MSVLQAPRWYSYRDDGHRLVLNLHIQPNASRTEVTGLHGEALRIKVAAPPADHAANDALLEFLRKSFKVGRRQVVLRHGEHARQKVVEILDPACAPESLLESWTERDVKARCGKHKGIVKSGTAELS